MKSKDEIVDGYKESKRIASNKEQKLDRYYQWICKQQLMKKKDEIIDGYNEWKKKRWINSRTR